jgi:beta-ribofuranosylaminobenzene 5'-phosphate synthase
MLRPVSVSAPSRLHFGLWSLASAAGRQFGGVGAMIDEPGIRLVIRPSQELHATGPLAERAIEFARRWAAFQQQASPPCHIEVVSAPPDHVGLGSGTQLALAVAAGLNAFHDLTIESAQELANSVGRGLRSAVGTYGFLFGGLVIEQGKLPDEPISPLDCRLDLPAEWRFVLVRPHGLAGLAGEDEAAAIGGLPAVPQAITDELIALAYEKIVPAAVRGDFDAFADSLYRYGHLAGEIFAARQGGPYNGPVLTALVARIREFGFAGVGQSSWGPTVFAAAPSHAEADRLARCLRTGLAAGELEMTIARPSRNGAQIEVLELGELATAR